MKPFVFVALLGLAVPQEERVRQLMEKLDDERLEVRDEAERELVKIGDPALRALREAASASDRSERRARAERAVREIEFLGDLRKAYGEPKPVTIRAAGKALNLVLEEISRQTGLTLEASAADKTSPVTIDAKDAPLLKVLDEICRGQAKRTYERRSDGSIRFLAAPHPKAAAAYVGPFCLRLSKLETVVEPVGKPRAVYIEFDGDCERYPKPVGKLAVEVESAVDDKGTALEIKDGYWSATKISTRGSMTTFGVADIVVHPPPDPYEFTVSGVAPGASKLTLRGKATFAIPHRPREVIFDKLEKGQSKDSNGRVIILDQIRNGVILFRVPSASGTAERLFELAGQADPESLVAVDRSGKVHRGSTPFVGSSTEGAYFGVKFLALDDQQIRDIRFRFRARYSPGMASRRSGAKS